MEDVEADEIIRIWPNNYKPVAIISDIDGTIADVEHRRHHVQITDGKKKDWKSFFTEMNKDPILMHVYEVLFKFNSNDIDSPHIIFCSGRSNEYREITKEWLNKTGLRYSGLYMRDRSDMRTDWIVKEQLLDFEILTRFKPLFVLDDRNSVVKMWRRRGIPCFQVADGDF